MEGNFNTHKWFKNQYFNENEESDLIFSNVDSDTGKKLQSFLLEHLQPGVNLDTLSSLINKYVDGAVEDQNEYYDY